MEEAIEEAIRNGHNRFKLRLVQGPDPDRAVLHAARKAAGELELMADPGEIYSPTSLKEIWNDIGQAGISWLEEPFPTDEPEMYDEFRSWSPRPKLALGESSYGITGIKSLIDRFQPEVVQPDITKTGGISEGIQLARYTLEKGREFVPHMLAGPIGFLASANLVAGIDGAEMVEMDCAPVPTFGPMAGGVPEVANGEIRLGNEVGHGAVVDEAQLSDWIEV